MNDNFKLDIPYIAGLFDAKGTVSQRNKVWKMEISMPDKNVIELIHETFECGTLLEKKVAGKKHWCWQCINRDCFFIAGKLWPHVVVKLHKIEQIIDHFEPDIQELGDNVVDINLEREKRK